MTSAGDLHSIIAGASALTDEGVADLARELASSGATLDAGPDTADLASTGGPSSLSTIIAPLYLRSFGMVIPKLGIAGRPAGGIDVMAQIPGFRTVLKPAEITRILDEAGYAHFEAGDTFAPMDARLFRVRQDQGAQAVPSLVIASLLSKKLAVGVRRVGIDVRVGEHGNFGGDIAAARENARRLTHIADLIDIRAVCFLTPGDFPYQAYIGRSEAIIALRDVIEGGADEWLSEHDAHCRIMAATIAGAERVSPGAFGEIRRVFERHLTAHGATYEAMTDHANATLAKHITSLHANETGFADVNLGALRSILQRAQKETESTGAQYPDPAGIILRVRPGTFVERGTELATIRGATSALFADLATAIRTIARPRVHAFEVIG